MTRQLIGLLGIVLALGLTACNGTDGSGAGDPSDAEADARAFKQEMDGTAKTLLPKLMDAVGGRLGGMQAAFTERGGYGVWDYAADGVVYGLPGTADEALAKATTVLEDAGFTVSADTKQKTVRGTREDLSVIVQSASLVEEGVASLNLHMGGTDPDFRVGDYAEGVGKTDYLAFLDPAQVQR